MKLEIEIFNICIQIVSTCATKVWCKVDGWVGAKASLRIAYSNKNIPNSETKTYFKIGLSFPLFMFHTLILTVYKKAETSIKAKLLKKKVLRIYKGCNNQFLEYALPLTMSHF